MKDFGTVLITGTTSGIGKGLLEHYVSRGATVICVNRRQDPELAHRFPKVHFKEIDVSSYDSVSLLMSDLKKQNVSPSLLILNAGINKPDNFEDRFDYPAFNEVLTINLDGIFTFVAAARELGFKKVTFLGISSVSNIVPNPGHIGYYLSKWGILKGFEFLQKNDAYNAYKTVVLGPIHTKIMRNYKGPIGFQRKIFDFLARDVEGTVRAITSFTQGSRAVLYYPMGACLFYLVMKWILKVLPFLYGGTRRSGN